jgi:hypothetical protein
MADLTEESFTDLMSLISEPMSLRPSQLIVSQEGIDRMKFLCSENAEFRKRVLDEFPQLDGIV